MTVRVSPLRQPDPATQNGRILAYLREHPRSTIAECYAAMHPPITNIRARHSDLRLQFGIEVVCERRSDGYDGFRVVEGELTLPWSESEMRYAHGDR